jgi:hypothetical protein
MVVLGADDHFGTAPANIDKERLLLAEMDPARHTKLDEAGFFRS